jgi:hypothetical protein
VSHLFGYALRANVVSLLAEHGIAHWQLQQDTFWHRNIFEHDFDQLLADNNGTADYDVLFDQLDASDQAIRAGWINGI